MGSNCGLRIIQSGGDAARDAWVRGLKCPLPYSGDAPISNWPTASRRVLQQSPYCSPVCSKRARKPRNGVQEGCRLPKLHEREEKNFEKLLEVASKLQPLNEARRYTIKSDSLVVRGTSFTTGQSFDPKSRGDDDESKRSHDEDTCILQSRNQSGRGSGDYVGLQLRRTAGRGYRGESSLGNH